MDLARSSYAMDDLPDDFTVYLSRRLGLSEEEAKRLLAAWLTSYEPVTRRPIRGLARTRGTSELGQDGAPVEQRVG